MRNVEEGKCLVAGNTNAPVIAFALKAVTELINEY